MAHTVDCLIIGGGPAGLTAAIYVARFRLSTQVIDGGASRAALIPCTRNHAGFPGGIGGEDLVARMRRQAIECGARVGHGQVALLNRQNGLFLGQTDAGEHLKAKAVILATGVSNRRPVGIPDDLHAAAVAAGFLRYCPVCDGFEVTDRNVAVIGTGEHGTKEALFLRAYTRDISLISPGRAHDLSSQDRKSLSEAGIGLFQGPLADFAMETSGISLSCAGERLCFDSAYPALGSDSHSELASSLGADLSDLGCVLVDKHQRTSVPGLYAAGDVVLGLDQISHAMGEAGVAATTLRNDLAKIQQMRR